MNQKEAKKIRRQFRRELKVAAEKQIERKVAAMYIRARRWRIAALSFAGISVCLVVSIIILLSIGGAS